MAIVLYYSYKFTSTDAFIGSAQEWVPQQLAMGGGGTQKTLPFTAELFIIDRLMKMKHHCL